MSWEDQGRQEHGWFGHGTASQAPKGAPGGGASSPGGLAERVQAVAYGAIAALPRSLRKRAEAQYHYDGTLSHLTEAMTAWIRGGRLDRASFAHYFLGRAADDPIAQTLHGAALAAGLATSPAELRDASEKIAAAMQALGLDRWPRFLADAQERARDPATGAAIKQSERTPDPRKDAIRPVYPIETALGIAAGGIAGGALGAVRAAGGAIARQLVPESSSSGNTAGNAAPSNLGVESPSSLSNSDDPRPNATNAPPSVARSAISRQKQDGHIRGTAQNRNRLKQGRPTSTFDGDAAQADALTQEAWEKGTPVPKRPSVREYDFGRQIGTGPSGESQSVVRVHQDSAGRIHGHPSGQVKP